MLFLTAFGVGYLMTRSFGLAWTWIEFGGLYPTEWTFYLDAFIAQMVPSLALVLLLALVSHAMVAGAVKRYSRLVDPGNEYRDLLRSIKTIDDLEDEDRLEQIKQHPELRDFLMGFKNRMAAREKQILEREKRGGAGRESGPGGNLPAEGAVLVSAINNGKAAFAKELALTIPELKQIERAVREQLSHDAPDAGQLETLRSRVERIVADLGARTPELRRDTRACADGAREIESLLTEIKNAAVASKPAAPNTAALDAALQQFETLAGELASLGEETRRVAIASALEASGGAPEGESIKVADALRTIATRFKTLATQWKQTAPALKSGVESIHNATASNAAGATLAAAAGTAVSKVQRWSERIVALEEQIQDLERAAGVESVEPSREWGETSLDDAAFETAGASQPVMQEAPPAESPAADAEPLAAPMELEARGGPAQPAPVEEPVSEPILEETPEPVVEETPEPVVEETPEPELAAAPEVEPEPAAESFEPMTHEVPAAEEEEAQFADIPGFEKERRVFNERPVQAAPEESSTDGLEVEQSDDATLEETAAAEGDATGDAGSHDDGFLTGPRGEDKPKQKQGKSPAGAGAQADVSRVATMEDESPVYDLDADAIDLYALGAVDYVEGVHA
jgi:hypothetical protein